MPRHVSCGGVVARVAQERVLVALVRERPGALPVLPKGHREYGESLEQAAIREIEEEAGITDLTLLANLGEQERMDYAKTSWKTIHYFLYFTQQALGDPTDPHKAYEVEWHDLHALPDMFWPEQRELISSNTVFIEQAARRKHAQSRSV